MTWRVLLEGGPLDGQQAVLERANLPEATEDWPEAFDAQRQPPRGRYVLAKQEPVPFAMGEHPHLLLTATYSWEAAP